MSSVVRFREAVRRENAGRDRLGYRYSEELRALAVAYLRAAQGRGLSKSEVSLQLGVSHVSLDRWSRELSGGFRAVEVLEPEEVPRRGGVVVSPGGWRIEGLTIQEIALLLRDLG